MVSIIEKSMKKNMCAVDEKGEGQKKMTKNDKVKKIIKNVKRKGY